MATWLVFDAPVDTDLCDRSLQEAVHLRNKRRQPEEGIERGSSPRSSPTAVAPTLMEAG
jgi:hypothetical protein